MPPNESILNKLDDLIKQATTEHSHFYTASTLMEAKMEILWLRNQLDFYKEHKDLDFFTIPRLKEDLKKVECELPIVGLFCMGGDYRGCTPESCPIAKGCAKT